MRVRVREDAENTPSMAHNVAVEGRCHRRTGWGTQMHTQPLHARAASKLVELTSTYSSDIQIGHDKMVDGKSILSLMMLAAVKGTELNVEVDGSDEKQAITSIIALINDKFGEDE